MLFQIAAASLTLAAMRQQQQQNGEATILTQTGHNYCGYGQWHIFSTTPLSIKQNL